MLLLRAALLLILPVSASVAAAAPDRQAIAHYADTMLATNFAADGPGAVVLIARGDEIVYRGARGMASLELGVALSPDQVFRLGSVTKQFAAAGVLKLVEQGKVSLDDPLTKFVPGYPNGDNVTVRMLLNHTSGIRSYTDIPGRMDLLIGKDMTTKQLIDSFKDEKADFAPGAQWNYNNSGYVLVGAVIESASGKPWYDYLDQVFFQPLRLKHTEYGDEAIAVIPGHVGGYTRVGDHWALARYLSMSQPHAAGALVSTVDDLLRWNRALHGGAVLSKASYEQMITPIGKAKSAHYGFGIEHATLRGKPVLKHSGGIFGFNTELIYLPESATTVAVLENFDAGKKGMAGASELGHRLAAFAIGKPYPDRNAIPVDSETLKSYEGVYRIDKDSARAVRVVDGTLTSQRTGGGKFVLIPIARDNFVFEEGLSRVQFERNRKGNVVAMRFFENDESKGQRVARTAEPLPAERVSTTLPEAAMKRVAGVYRHDGNDLTIALSDSGMTAQMAGQPAFELFAESATRFFIKEFDVTLEFPPGSKPAASLISHQGGRATTFTRIAE
ncbi:MAG TPA: serine hydrolase [Dokdonella sp.]|uniref:serine hydrolase n=1 Tax=Dokdonella sp. TaxID=2291710 RepID=UPI002D7FABB8|nr:serine hydrolase [Dokdonella sp.]HET9031885.1 serine hydrolase [Dokdonella sp.]